MNNNNKKMKGFGNLNFKNRFSDKLNHMKERSGSMRNRLFGRGKNQTGDQKLSEMLSGTWAVEVPSDVNTNPLSPVTDSLERATSLILPLVQINEKSLKVALLPLNEDMPNSVSIREYLNNVIKSECHIEISNEENGIVQLVWYSAEESDKEKEKDKDKDKESTQNSTVHPNTVTNESNEEDKDKNSSTTNNTNSNIMSPTANSNITGLTNALTTTNATTATATTTTTAATNNDQNNENETITSNNTHRHIELEGSFENDCIRWSDNSQWHKLQSNGFGETNAESEERIADVSAPTPTSSSTPTVTFSGNISLSLPPNIKNGPEMSPSLGTIQESINDTSEKEKEKEKEKANDASRQELTNKVRDSENRARTLEDKLNLTKSQAQATMTQLADLSRQYTEMQAKHKDMEKKYIDATNALEAAQMESKTMKESFAEITDQLRKAKDQIVYKNVQETQLKLSQAKEENAQFQEQINLQQQQILSLQDQLQHSQLSARQHMKTIQELETRLSRQEKEYNEKSATIKEQNEQLIELKRRVEELSIGKETLTKRYEEKLTALQQRQENEIQQLQRGFQETLRTNQKQIDELEALRNSYAKKNTSLSKDVRRLIQQLESQTKATASGMNSHNNSSGSLMSNSTSVSGNENQENIRLRRENMQLSEELIRKSQGLVDALRAIAELHENAEDETLRIRQSLSMTSRQSHTNNTGGHNNHNTTVMEHSQSNQNLHLENMDFKTNEVSSFDDVTQQLQQHMASTTSPKASPGGGSWNDQNGNAKGNFIINVKAKERLTDIRNRFGGRIKKSLEDVQKKVRETSLISPTANLANRLTSSHSTVVVGHLSRNQLQGQCETLQSLANELALTVEQKEEMLESLRFANTFLGKRVIALEKLLQMEPGGIIPNEQALMDQVLGAKYSGDTEVMNENVPDEKINETDTNGLGKKEEEHLDQSQSQSQTQPEPGSQPEPQSNPQSEPQPDIDKKNETNNTDVDPQNAIAEPKLEENNINTNETNINE